MGGVSFVYACVYIYIYLATDNRRAISLVSDVFNE